MAKDLAAEPTESLGRRAYHVLRQAVRDGIIQPDRYYSESELGQLLGVSRTPVREALKALERDGVLDAARQRGYRLRTYEDADVEEMLALRKTLERFALTRLIEVVTDSDVDALRAAVARQREPGATDHFFGLDEEFHLLIAELANLPMTRSMLSALRTAMAIVIAGVQISAERTQVAIDEHERLVDAIERRDPHRALEVLDAHIENATRGLLEARRAREQEQKLTLERA
jgi:DNA-binding GntR family transcriptional regulator